jgi:hypothetical protein
MKGVGMFLRTANLEVDVGPASAVIDRIRDDLVVPLSANPGFFAYYVLELPNSVVSTIRIFEDQASMDAATQATASILDSIIQDFSITNVTFSDGEIATGVAYARLFF